MNDKDVEALIDHIMDILSWTISDYACRKQELYKAVCDELSEYKGKFEDVKPAEIATIIRKKMR